MIVYNLVEIKINLVFCIVLQFWANIHQLFKNTK